MAGQAQQYKAVRGGSTVGTYRANDLDELRMRVAPKIPIRYETEIYRRTPSSKWTWVGSLWRDENAILWTNTKGDESVVAENGRLLKISSRGEILNPRNARLARRY